MILWKIISRPYFCGREMFTCLGFSKLTIKLRTRNYPTIQKIIWFSVTNNLASLSILGVPRIGLSKFKTKIGVRNYSPQKNIYFLWGIILHPYFFGRGMFWVFIYYFNFEYGPLAVFLYSELKIRMGNYSTESQMFFWGRISRTYNFLN